MQVHLDLARDLRQQEAPFKRTDREWLAVAPEVRRMAVRRVSAANPASSSRRTPARFPERRNCHPPARRGPCLTLQGEEAP